MKQPTPYPVVALVSLILAPFVCAQEQAPAQAEYELLAAIAGEYTYEYTEVGQPTQTGEIVFELIPGGRFLRFEEDATSPDGSPMRIMGFIGYDSVHRYFTWYRVFDNGAYDQARGTLEDGTLTFDMTESHTEPFGDSNWAGPGVRLRTKWTGFSEGGLTRFSWERSVNGGPWERLSEGRNTRVR